MVRDFWNRKPIKGVGLAMKLNYWQSQENNNPHLKEIRKEAVRYFTGIGNYASKDGVFNRQEKSAANFASGLSKDALDLHRRSMIDYDMADEESK